jgi:hypothetical protein
MGSLLSTLVDRGVRWQADAESERFALRFGGDGTMGGVGVIKSLGNLLEAVGW